MSQSVTKWFDREHTILVETTIVTIPVAHPTDSAIHRFIGWKSRNFHTSPVFEDSLGVTLYEFRKAIISSLSQKTRMIALSGGERILTTFSRVMDRRTDGRTKLPHQYCALHSWVNAAAR